MTIPLILSKHWLSWIPVRLIGASSILARVTPRAEKIVLKRFPSSYGLSSDFSSYVAIPLKVRYILIDDNII